MWHIRQRKSANNHIWESGISLLKNDFKSKGIIKAVAYYKDREKEQTVIRKLFSRHSHSFWWWVEFDQQIGSVVLRVPRFSTMCILHCHSSDHHICSKKKKKVCYSAHWATTYHSTGKRHLYRYHFEFHRDRCFGSCVPNKVKTVYNIWDHIYYVYISVVKENKSLANAKVILVYNLAHYMISHSGK